MPPSLSLAGGCATSDLNIAAAAPEDSQIVSLDQANVSSPSGDLQVSLSAENGTLAWTADWRGSGVIQPSALGLAFKSGRDLNRDLIIASVSRASHDETWEQPWGERPVCSRPAQ